MQSAHWHKKQVTVFTAALWYRDSCSSTVIVSDNLNHSKESIVVFVHKLLSNLVEASVKMLQVWTDGPSNQFKNRFVASAIPWLEEQHGLKLCWNFFAASHGKEPVDAIGGIIKRIATQKVIQRKVLITDVLTFYEAVKNETLVNVYFVSIKDINNTILNFEIDDLFKKAPTKPGIFSAHQIQNNNGTTEMRSYSSVKYLVKQLTVPEGELIITVL